MGEELILARNRFILSLLRQNFIRVDGPRLEDENRISYDIWNRRRDLDDAHRVRIAFERAFLSKPDNDFARTMLQALREAKEMLRRAHGGKIRGGGSAERPDEAVQIGHDTVRRSFT